MQEMIIESKSMMVVKSEWNNRPTFKMIPVGPKCPYVECIYDPESKVLAIIGQTRKNVFHMMPKLDDNGDVVLRKVKTDGAKPYKEERRTVETFQEYYISDSSQILEFIEMFAINPKVTEEYLSDTQQ
jgi:Mg2+ and Co2+ transporter CorA